MTPLISSTQRDEGAAKLQEGQMDVSPVLVADLQAPEAVEPGERPLNHHPAVASQAVLGLDTTAGDAADDAALAQVSNQVVTRYEETEYETVEIARLQEILDAIGIKALVTLSA